MERENIRDSVTEYEDASYTVPCEQRAHMGRDVSELVEIMMRQ